MDNIQRLSHADEIEQQAADWVAKMDADTPLTTAELGELKQWINRSPAHRAELNRLIAFWQEANALTELSFPLPAKSSRWQWGWQPVAAIAMTVVLAITLLISPVWEQQPRIAANGIYETRIGEQNAITLIDGSVIELNTHSRVQVDYSDQRRSIKLMQGEAYFDVSKDPDRPFEVNAGGGVVRAVGTAFAVHYQQEAVTVTVTVTEGKVELNAATAAQTNLPPQQKTETAQLGALVAGQRAAFNPVLAQNRQASSQPLQITEVKQTLAWREGLLMFSGEPLTDVVKEMNRYTALTIEIADPDIANLQVGGQFKVGETRAMLDNLSVSFNLEVRQVNDTLVQLVSKKAKK